MDSPSWSAWYIDLWVFPVGLSVRNRSWGENLTSSRGLEGLRGEISEGLGCMEEASEGVGREREH